MFDKVSHTPSDAKAPFKGLGVKNPYKSGDMFEAASHVIFENAKHLRKNMTEAEKFLWLYLKKGINGFRFRRQHPIGVYIADFYCHHAKLIIEIDGGIHREKDIIENDIKRQWELESWGYNIIRFTNQQVMTTVEKVILKIETEILETNNLQKQNTPQSTESKSPL